VFADGVVTGAEASELVGAVGIGLGRGDDVAILIQQVDRDALEPVVVRIVEVAVLARIGVDPAGFR
jgi:hypothetical protein